MLRRIVQPWLLLLALAACSSGSDLKGSGAKEAKAAKDVAAAPATTAAPADGVVSDEATSSKNAVSSAGDLKADAAPPDWADLVDVKCDWDGVEADKIVTIRCEMFRTDGQPLPADAQVPISWELHAADGTPRAGASFKDDPARAGLRLGGFSDFFHKVVQFITAPIETIATDVLHIKLGGGLLAKVFDLPIFKRIPVLKDGLSLGVCLATTTFPAFCFVKFGLKIADRIIGGMGHAGDGRAILEVHQYHTAEGRHGYLPAGTGPPWIDDGPAFYTIRDELPGTQPLFACNQANGAAFVSQKPDCEGRAVAGPLGRYDENAHEGAALYTRCVFSGEEDHLVVTNTATCAEAGYAVEGPIGYLPLPDYTH